MPRIEVDPGGLASAAAALRAATEVAREVHRGARSLSDSAGAAGHPQLTADLDSFRSTWAYGLGLVVDDATTLARMLEQGASAYSALDGAVARACGA